MIDMFFTGDVLINRETIIPNIIKKEIKKCDFSICNFEAPLTHSSSKKYIKAGPNLKQDLFSLNFLKKIGFDVLTLSNNHIIDYGIESIKNTIQEIEKNELMHSGFYLENEEVKALRLKKNGISVTLITCAENTEGCLKYNDGNYGYLWINSKRLKYLIKKEKQNCDYVIVSTHAGLEDVQYPLQQWKKKYRKLIKYGADIIIGHHPHVAQGIEKFKHGLIFFSLGNFIFDYPNKSIEKLPSLSVKISLSKKSIKYTLFYHKKMNDKLILLDQSDKIEKKLNQKLVDNIENEIALNSIIEERFKSFKMYINIYAFGISRFNFRNIFKYIFYKFYNINIYKKKRYKLFEHLIIIDTNRYLLKKYMDLKKRSKS